jgi:hypothetical protein
MAQSTIIRNQQNLFSFETERAMRIMHYIKVVVSNTVLGARQRCWFGLSEIRRNVMSSIGHVLLWVSEDRP